MDSRCIYGLENVPDQVKGCVLTIGNFDGVHLGHQLILSTARKLADTENAPVVAMTFDPPPDLVLRPDDLPQRILPLAQRTERLICRGADYVVIAKADMQLLGMSPQAFENEIILETFAPRHMVEGDNFFYGSRRGGNVETLRQAGKTNGFDLHVVESVFEEIEGEALRVSSTLIRGLLLAGKVEAAAVCLGKEFALYGKIVHGHGRGRSLDFPTANLDAGEQILPADGVYAGWAQIGEHEWPAAISVGSQPTFKDGVRAVEAYILGPGGDYYDQEMVLRFASRVRALKQFEGSDQLKAQIAKDVKRVRELCGVVRPQ